MQSILNETTPSIQQYTLIHEIDGIEEDRLSLRGQNTSVRRSGAQLKLGKINCFGIAAVNSVGTGPKSYVCKKGKLVLLGYCRQA